MRPRDWELLLPYSGSFAGLLASRGHFADDAIVGQGQGAPKKISHPSLAKARRRQEFSEITRNICVRKSWAESHRCTYSRQRQQPRMHRSTFGLSRGEVLAPEMWDHLPRMPVG